MSARCFFVCGAVLVLFTNVANGARYQRTQDGKTLVWNNLRGVAEQVKWSGGRDSNGYAIGEGTLTWYRLGKFVNSYTGKMVRGKFEGPVIRGQGQTRLQTTFVNGEKVGDWSEPGSTRTPAPTPQKQSPEAAETQPTERPIVERPSPTPTLSPLPTPSPTRSPTPSPTPRLTPTPTPTSTPSPTPTPRLTPTPTARPTATPTPIPAPTSTPTPARSAMPTPAEARATKNSRLEEIIEGPVHDSLELTSPAPSLGNALEEVPWAEARPSWRISPSPSSSAVPRVVVAKERMTAELRKQIESVLAQVRDATGKFRAIERLDAVRALPAPVSAKVTFLANQGREYRVKMGYERTLYEHLDELETVDALVAVDEITRDLAAKDAPAARKELSAFFRRYSEPTAEDRKAMWRYLNSAFSVCDRLKTEAEPHLQQARSLESAGRKAEALREYQEIYRIYPNPLTADKIRQLEAQSR